MKNIYLIIGRTCSGKTTLAKKMEEKLGLKILKSWTDRAPRTKEEETGFGDHIFLTEEEFNRIPNENMIAYTEINGHRYCATKDQLEDVDIYIIDPAGVERIKENDELCSMYNFIEIYVKCNAKTRLCRYLERSDKNRNAVDILTEFYDRDASENEEFGFFEQCCMRDVDVIISTDRIHF